MQISIAFVSLIYHRYVWQTRPPPPLPPPRYMGYYGIWSTSTRYASYWNAFLFWETDKIQVMYEFINTLFHLFNFNWHNTSPVKHIADYVIRSAKRYLYQCICMKLTPKTLYFYEQLLHCIFLKLLSVS